MAKRSTPSTHTGAVLLGFTWTELRPHIGTHCVKLWYQQIPSTRDAAERWGRRERFRCSCCLGTVSIAVLLLLRDLDSRRGPMVPQAQEQRTSGCYSSSGHPICNLCWGYIEHESRADGSAGNAMVCCGVFAAERRCGVSPSVNQNSGLFGGQKTNDMVQGPASLRGCTSCEGVILAVK